jgi:hypothetical protein
VQVKAIKRTNVTLLNDIQTAEYASPIELCISLQDTEKTMVYLRIRQVEKVPAACQPAVEKTIRVEEND